ncbi:MAG: AAA family ATPase [Desulfovibrio sp.]|jgi:BioD-like phosphotransacetylase family protein|nr:AAA family ATPase [Desulfovibrio sp.]
MTKGIYIGSTANRAGKSLLAFSLGLLLRKTGLSVGYIKPVGSIHQKKDDLLGDADAMVVQELLGQDAPPDVVSPVMLPDNPHSAAWTEAPDGALRRIREAYERVCRDKDVCIVSGTGAFPWAGRGIGADALAVLGHLRVNLLLVERFRRGINCDRLLWFKDRLGPDLIGVVLNDVPEEEMKFASEVLRPRLQERGVHVFGILGHEPELESIRVIDLAHGLKGRIVAGNEGADSAVSSFFVGATQPDNFLLSMKGRSNCAVILEGDRPDLQILALASDAACVILSGNVAPIEMVRSKAEEKNTALIRARESSYFIARRLAVLMKSKKIRDLNQVRAGVRLVERSLDIRSILDRI